MAESFKFILKYSFVLCLPLLCSNLHCQIHTEDIYDTLLSRIHQEELASIANVTSLDSLVQIDIQDLDTATGRWFAYDYTDHKRINPSWQPVLGKMHRMTIAYTHPTSQWFGNNLLYTAINNSLRFFTHHRPLPYCDNWYTQGITRPQSLVLSLINMRFGEKALEKEVEISTIQAICKDTAVKSNGRNNPMHHYNYGANKANIALGWIYIGSLLKNNYMLEVGVREVYAPIAYTTGEGIQYDLSYDMHFGYLYNGSYGTDFMNSVIKTAYLTRNTRYSLSQNPYKFQLFRQFILCSVFGVIRGRWLDWNVIGRGISREGTLQRNYINQLNQLIAIDPIHKQDYTNIIERMKGHKPPSYGIRPNHQHYWHTDFTIHTRPAYYFSIHAVSNRNHSQEIGNMENMKGYWGAEGTTNLQKTGDEYYNIFPLWDWTKLPGTTLPDSLPVIKDKAPGSGDRQGTDSFSGGVSDSLYGMTAYVMNNDMLTSAKKAWFMFDKEIVCLGAGINSTLAGKKVFTTVNQCISRGNSIIYTDGVLKNYPTNHPPLYLNNTQTCILHDGVGYIFSKGGNLQLTNETRVSGWNSIDHSIDSNTSHFEKNNVFQLVINHGLMPLNQKYAYIILPNVNNQYELTKYSKNNDIQIIYNSDSIQAVAHSKLNIKQIALYKAGLTYNDDEIELYADKPILILLRKIQHNQYKLNIADPTQKLAAIKIRVKIKNYNAWEMEIPLPDNEFAGRSISTMIRF